MALILADRLEIEKAAVAPVVAGTTGGINDLSGPHKDATGHKGLNQLAAAGRRILSML